MTQLFRMSNTTYSHTMTHLYVQCDPFIALVCTRERSRLQTQKWERTPAFTRSLVPAPEREREREQEQEREQERER